MDLKRRRLTCSCSINACGEVLRRSTCDGGLLANLLTEAAASALRGRVVRQRTAVHLITSPLRKEVNEAVC